MRIEVEGLQSTKEKWGILEPGGDGLHHTAGVMASQTPVDLKQTTVPVLCSQSLRRGAEDQEWSCCGCVHISTETECPVK